MNTAGEAEQAAVTVVYEDERVTRLRLQLSKLTVTEGPDRGKELMIDTDRILVGRSAVCDLVLDDHAVSSVHCEIRAAEDGFVLRDMGSTNGTYAGDFKVQEVWLFAGATIRVGHTHLCFERQDATVDIELSARESFHLLRGKSLRMREVFATLERVAATQLTVLIQGETGTGKELAARSIHAASDRADKPFVVLDCGSIPRNLIESTLFGHEKGAFTGATERRLGAFEEANGGTIFLDEIGELDLGLQPRLLRVLESREIRRVGSPHPQAVDVRVLAATNRDLRHMVAEGSFREDLFYRIGAVEVQLPPLRERSDDIPLLAKQILKELEPSLQRPDKAAPLRLSSDALLGIATYSWPGNVRELRNTLERAVSMSEGELIQLSDLVPTVRASSQMLGVGQSAIASVDTQTPFKQAKQRMVEAFEMAYVESLLQRYDGNITRCAQAAGLTRYHLRELAKRFGSYREP